MLSKIVRAKRTGYHATHGRLDRRSASRLAVALVGALSVLAVGASAASAQGTPPQFGSVSSGTPTSTSITVEASINPEGQDTTYIVDYGATPSYGSSTAAADAGAGSSLVNISVTVPNLAPATAYHLQLVLTNASGSVSSPDMVLETSPSPSTPPGGSPTTTTSAPTGTPSKPTKPVTTTSTAVERLVRVGFPSAGMAHQTLGGITCATSSACFAVGSGGGALSPKKLPSFAQLIARRVGATWSVMASPRLADSSLDGIACVDATNCMAVGGVGEPAASTLAEHWNGRSWSRLSTANPATGGNGDQLYGVSCATASECFAVGGGNLGTSAAFPLIERWNGAAWSSVAPAPTPKHSYFTAVSCLDAIECWAVGYSPSHLLVQRWNGRSWATAGGTGVASGPALGLDAITCRTTATCWAGGESASSAPLLLRLEGGTWRAVAGAPGTGGAVSALACASARDCWAVGSGAENFDGSSWLTASTAVPSVEISYLAGVSCPSNSCVAVGFAGSVSTGGGLVEVSR